MGQPFNHWTDRIISDDASRNALIAEIIRWRAGVYHISNSVMPRALARLYMLAGLHNQAVQEGQTLRHCVKCHRMCPRRNGMWPQPSSIPWVLRHRKSTVVPEIPRRVGIKAISQIKLSRKNSDGKDRLSDWVRVSWRVTARPYGPS